MGQFYYNLALFIEPLSLSLYADADTSSRRCAFRCQYLAEKVRPCCVKWPDNGRDRVPDVEAICLVVDMHALYKHLRTGKAERRKRHRDLLPWKIARYPCRKDKQKRPWHAVHIQQIIRLRHAVGIAGDVGVFEDAFNDTRCAVEGFLRRDLCGILRGCRVRQRRLVMHFERI